MQSDVTVEDGAYVVAAVEGFRRQLDLDDSRLLTMSQLLILDDLKLSKLSVDKITQFGLRPPELRFVDKVGDYFCWFHIERKKISIASFQTHITEDLHGSCRIDALQHQVKLRRRALPK